jgi:plasmid stabilization system protein ParE
MKSGYKVLWTDHALTELSQAFQYLELNFSEKEINRLSNQIESVLRYISKYPKLYPESSQQEGVRRAVITKFNTLYYRINIDKNQIEILSFFSNREDPMKLEF